MSPIDDLPIKDLAEAIRNAEPDNLILGGSDQAIANMAIATGAKPDFTVTSADFREGGPNHFIIAWETVSAGFGELTFYRQDGKLTVDTEGMGARFCREVFEKLIERVIPREERKGRPTLKPQPFGHYEGHDLRRADMDVIWSVGATPELAIEALCKARWGGTLEKLCDPLESRDGLHTWGYRFLSDNGTGFKAAGIEVAGGFVCTWWK